MYFSGKDEVGPWNFMKHVQLQVLQICKDTNLEFLLKI